MNEDNDSPLSGMDYPSLGYYDFGGDDEDEAGDDDGDEAGRSADDAGEDDGDEAGGMDYPSLGARGRRYRTRGKSRRNRPGSATKRAPQVVQKTILVGQSAVVTGLARGVVTIRPQFDFVAEDVTFQASRHTVAAATVSFFGITQVAFGDRIIFSTAAPGVPEAVFATASFVRGLVKGAAIAAGLDITITGQITGGGAASTHVLIATVTGLKRGTSGCGPGAV